MNSIVLLLVSGLSVGALYFLLASGLSLIFGLMNVLSFAHGAFLAVGAYVGYQLATMSGALKDTPLWLYLLGIVLAIIIGAALAWCTEYFLIRPLYNRPNLDQLLVTMGLGFVIIALLQGIWGPNELAYQTPAWLQSTTSIGTAAVPNDRFIMIGAALVVYIGIELFLRNTRHGLIVRAGVENREMVRALGIDVRASFNLVFVLGGVTAGVGGVLAATYNNAVSPSTGDNLLLYSLIVLVVGGLGSIRGAIIAAAAVGLVQIFANFYIAQGFGDILVIVVMAVMLLVRPQGIFGRRGRLV